MDAEETGGACVVCTKPTDPNRRTDLFVKSERHPDSTYHFFMHTACLKTVAKPGFVGLKDL
jgi:hypothetical protein